MADLFSMAPATNMTYDFLGENLPGATSQPYSPSPFMGSSGNLVSEFLGGPKFEGITSSFLGGGPNYQSFTSSLGNIPDYSNIFGAAARGLRAGGGIGEAPSPRNPYQRTRPGAGSLGGGGMMPPPMMRTKAPPQLQSLAIPYAETQQRMMEVNPAEKLIAQAKALNVPYQEEFRRLFPQFETGLLSAGQTASSLLAGQIPRDVGQQVGRTAAQLGFSTGLGTFGRQGGLYGNILPKSLGLTSLDLMGRGSDLLGRTLGLTQAAMQTTMPVSPLQFAVAPGQVFDTLTAQAQFNTEIANQNLMNAWMANPYEPIQTNQPKPQPNYMPRRPAYMRR